MLFINNFAIIIAVKWRICKLTLCFVDKFFYKLVFDTVLNIYVIRCNTCLPAI